MNNKKSKYERNVEFIDKIEETSTRYLQELSGIAMDLGADTDQVRRFALQECLIVVSSILHQMPSDKLDSVLVNIPKELKRLINLKTVQTPDSL